MDISKLRSRILYAAVLGLLCCLVPGCQTATVQDPLTRTAGGSDPDQQIEFWHGLADRPVTCNDEAFHGLLLFADGQDPADDYGGRVAALKERGMLPAAFDAPAERAVDRGTLAVALAKVLNVRGGLVMSLLGASPRYAVRELQFLNVFPPSSPNQTFSGAEFLGIIGKAEEYQSTATRGSRSAQPVAEQHEQPADEPPPAATHPAPFPLLPPEPESPQSPDR